MAAYRGKDRIQYVNEMITSVVVMKTNHYLLTSELYSSTRAQRTHTHTHTYIYIYIYILLNGKINKPVHI